MAIDQRKAALQLLYAYLNKQPPSTSCLAVPVPTPTPPAKPTPQTNNVPVPVQMPHSSPPLHTSTPISLPPPVPVPTPTAAAVRASPAVPHPQHIIEAPSLNGLEDDKAGDLFAPEVFNPLLFPETSPPPTDAMDVDASIPAPAPVPAGPVKTRTAVVYPVVVAAAKLQAALATKKDTIQKLQTLHKPAGQDRLVRRLQEPMRRKTHWDNLLAEMVWASTDITSERNWKRGVAQALAVECANAVAARAQRKLEEKQAVEGDNDVVMHTGGNTHRAAAPEAVSVDRPTHASVFDLLQSNCGDAAARMALATSIASLVAASSMFTSPSTAPAPALGEASVWGTDAGKAVFWGTLQRTCFNFIATYGRLSQHGFLNNLSMFRPTNNNGGGFESGVDNDFFRQPEHAAEIASAVATACAAFVAPYAVLDKHLHTDKQTSVSPDVYSLRDPQVVLARSLFLTQVLGTSAVLQGGVKHVGVGRVAAAAQSIISAALFRSCVASAEAAAPFKSVKEVTHHSLAVVLLSVDHLQPWIEALKAGCKRTNTRLNASKARAAVALQAEVLRPRGGAVTLASAGPTSCQITVKFVLSEDLSSPLPSPPTAPVDATTVTTAAAYALEGLRAPGKSSFISHTVFADVRSVGSGRSGPLLADITLAAAAAVHDRLGKDSKLPSSCIVFGSDDGSDGGLAAGSFVFPSLRSSEGTLLLGNEHAAAVLEPLTAAHKLLMVPLPAAEAVAQPKLLTPVFSLDGLLLTQETPSGSQHGDTGVADDLAVAATTFFHARLERRVYCPASTPQSRAWARLAVAVEKLLIRAIDASPAPAPAVPEITIATLGPVSSPPPSATAWRNAFLNATLCLSLVHASSITGVGNIQHLRYSSLDEAVQWHTQPQAPTQPLLRASPLHCLLQRSEIAALTVEHPWDTLPGSGDNLVSLLCSLHYASMHPAVHSYVEADTDGVYGDELAPSMPLSLLFNTSGMFAAKRRATVGLPSVASAWYASLRGKVDGAYQSVCRGREWISKGTQWQLPDPVLAPKYVPSLTCTKLVDGWVDRDVDVGLRLSAEAFAPDVCRTFQPVLLAHQLDAAATGALASALGTRINSAASGASSKAKKRASAASSALLRTTRLSGPAEFLAGTAPQISWKTSSPVVDTSYVFALSPKLAGIVSAVREAIALGQRTCVLLHSGINVSILEYILSASHITYAVTGFAPHAHPSIEPQVVIVNLQPPTHVLAEVTADMHGKKWTAGVLAKYARELYALLPDASILDGIDAFLVADAPPPAPSHCSQLVTRLLLSKAVLAALLADASEAGPITLLQFTALQSPEDSDFLTGGAVNALATKISAYIVRTAPHTGKADALQLTDEKVPVPPSTVPHLLEALLSSLSSPFLSSPSTAAPRRRTVSKPVALVAMARAALQRSCTVSESTSAALLLASTFDVVSSDLQASQTVGTRQPPEVEMSDQIVDGALRIAGVGLSRVFRGGAPPFLPLGPGNAAQMEARASIVSAAHAVQNLKGKRRLLNTALAAVGVIREHQNQGGLHFSHTFAPSHFETRVLSAPPALISEPAIASVARTTISFLERPESFTRHIREKALPAPSIPKAQLRGPITQHKLHHNGTSVPAVSSGLGASLVEKTSISQGKSHVVPVGEALAPDFRFPDGHAYTDGVLQASHKSRGPKATAHASAAVMNGHTPLSITPKAPSHGLSNPPQPFHTTELHLPTHQAALPAAISTALSPAGGVGVGGIAVNVPEDVPIVHLRQVVPSEGATPAFVATQLANRKAGLPFDVTRLFPATNSSFTGLSITGGREDGPSILFTGSGARNLHIPQAVLPSITPVEGFGRGRHVRPIASRIPELFSNLYPAFVDDLAADWECVVRASHLSFMLATFHLPPPSSSTHGAGGLSGRKRSRAVFDLPQSREGSTPLEPSPFTCTHDALMALKLAKNGLLPLKQAVKLAQAALKNASSAHAGTTFDNVSAVPIPTSTSDWTIYEDIFLLQAVAEVGYNWDCVREVMRAASLPLPQSLQHPHLSVSQSSSSFSQAATSLIGQRFGPTAALAAAAKSRPFRSARLCHERFKKLTSRSITVTAVLPPNASNTSTSALATALGVGTTPSTSPPSTIGVPGSQALGFGLNAGIHVGDKGFVRIVVDHVTVPVNLKRLRASTHSVGLYHVRPRAYDGVSPSPTSTNSQDHGVTFQELVSHSLIPASTPRARQLLRVGNIMYECKKARPHLQLQSSVNTDVNIPVGQENMSFQTSMARVLDGWAVDSGDTNMKVAAKRGPTKLLRHVPFHRGTQATLPFPPALTPPFDHSSVNTSAVGTSGGSVLEPLPGVNPLAMAHAPVVGPFRKTSPYILTLKHKERERQRVQQAEAFPAGNPGAGASLSLPVPSMQSNAAGDAAKTFPAAPQQPQQVPQAAAVGTAHGHAPSAATTIIQRLLESPNIQTLGVPPQELEQMLMQVIDEATAAQISSISTRPDMNTEQKDDAVRRIVMQRFTIAAGGK